MRTLTIIKNSLAALLLSLYISSCTASYDEDQGQSAQSIVQPTVDLQTAILTNNLEAVRQHLSTKSELNQKDAFTGSTPLISSATFNRPIAAQLLIDAGADLNIQNNDGATALHSAAFFGRIEIVQLLLDAKADKTIKNKYHVTARESIMADFEEMRPVYEMMKEQLAPMGLVLNLGEIKKARPVIRLMLE